MWACSGSSGVVPLAVSDDEFLDAWEELGVGDPRFVEADGCFLLVSFEAEDTFAELVGVVEDLVPAVRLMSSEVGSPMDRVSRYRRRDRWRWTFESCRPIEYLQWPLNMSPPAMRVLEIGRPPSFHSHSMHMALYLKEEAQ